jgi:hypothetical protein
MGNEDPDFPPPPGDTGMQFISDPLLFDPPPPPLVPFLTWVQQHRDEMRDRGIEFAERFALGCRRAWWRPSLRLVMKLPARRNLVRVIYLFQNRHVSLVCIYVHTMISSSNTEETISYLVIQYIVVRGICEHLATSDNPSSA